MSCPFCSNNKSIATEFPTINFNQKTFSYIRCVNCTLVYLDRFPDESDYSVMYPPSYQGNIVDTHIQKDPYKKLGGLRFSYGHHFDLIRARNAGSRILDYGCGTGNFCANAQYNGFICDGAEFSKDYVGLLKKILPGNNFFTIDEVLSNDFPVKYDIIRLSNVLEHLTNPKEVIRSLSNHLNPGGMLLVEGPIEDNFCIAQMVRKLYFSIGKLIKHKRTISAPPYHIFFSNAKNQRNFFKDCGMKGVYFEVAEDPWPFPESFRKAEGLGKKMMAIVARVSLATSRYVNKNWGNVFLYIGQKKD